MFWIYFVLCFLENIVKELNLLLDNPEMNTDRILRLMNSPVFKEKGALVPGKSSIRY